MMRWILTTVGKIRGHPSFLSTLVFKTQRDPLLLQL